MPIYTYECDECGAIKDEFRKIEERDASPECDLCRTNMRKVISSYYVVGDVAPYYDDNLQAHIRSKQHRRDVMREQGVTEKFGDDWHTSRKNKSRRPL